MHARGQLPRNGCTAGVVAVAHHHQGAELALLGQLGEPLLDLLLRVEDVLEVGTHVLGVHARS